MITDSITTFSVRNSNCIICGEAFVKERASKLYCSPRCRQAAYYHKDKIEAIRRSLSSGINKELLVISTKGYKEYQRLRERLRDYRKLESHFDKYEEGTKEWNLLYNNPGSSLTVERKKIPKGVLNLSPPDLSIDEWSFIRLLYPTLNITEFIQLTCSLSEEFMNQVKHINNNDYKSQIEKFQPIKHRYLQHLNKIASGIITFGK